MTKRLPSITELPVADIVVPKDRLRPISEAKVAALMRVIEEGVYLGAITVRRVGGKNVLVDGLHRLEAMSRLGRETIRVDAVECNQGEATRLEITGNILGGMTPIQDAIFLGVYQAEYEKLHPETKRGTAGALAKHGLQHASMHFAELVAETRQISPGQVRRVIAAGRSLTQNERRALQAVEHRIPMTEIEKLGKITDPALRARAATSLSLGQSVADAIRAAKALQSGVQHPVKDPVEEAFKDLSARWSRIPKAAKRRFVDEREAELTNLLMQRREAITINKTMGLPEDDPKGRAIIAARNRTADDGDV
jgi:ParB family transcriptional regulator, chromosome partitioning protein